MLGYKVSQILVCNKSISVTLQDCKETFCECASVDAVFQYNAKLYTRRDIQRISRLFNVYLFNYIINVCFHFIV